MPFRSLVAIAWLLAAPGAASAAPVRVAALPADIRTHDDGRRPIAALYADYLSLRDRGWSLDVVAESRPDGTEAALPVLALRSPSPGPAVWILAGIHGEEPAGPIAIAETIDAIAALGRRRPVVLMPLLNPHGYARNWRYLNIPAWSETVDGDSVGDSSHLLPDPAAPDRARAAAPSSPEAEAITGYVVETARTHPPVASIDLHEDSLIHEGYVYSQGTAGAADPLAIEAVAVLREAGVPIRMGGTTRFDEPIEAGIVGPVEDGSIDELMSAPRVILQGRPCRGPAARTVLVFETPAAALPLERRVAAHALLIRRLAARLAAEAPRADGSAP